jgi:signal transduction histidine kinase
MTNPMPEAEANQEFLAISPTMAKTLRYIEWGFLGIHLLRILFTLIYRPYGYEPIWGDYFVLGVFAVFFAFSVILPARRPLWQRRTYLWVEIVLLLGTRLFSHWGLDLLLLFVLVKSCFLLNWKEVLGTTIVSGILWNAVIAQYMAIRLSQPPEQFQEDLETALATPLVVQLFDVVLNSVTIFIAASLLIALLCLTVVSERKSRQREGRLQQEVELLAADLERARIARDIHDSLGHTLMSLDVQLELAQRLYERGSEQAQQALGTSKVLSSQSVQEVRRAVAAMRQEAFDLNTALIHLLEPFEIDPSITVQSRIELPKLPLQTSHQLYCMIKEALENIRRHSQARTIFVRGEATASEISLQIEDDGNGFDPTQPPSSFGLRGMQERAQLLGGTMQVNSSPGQGTSIHIRVPR